MKTKLIKIFFLLSTSLIALENSTVPLAEHYESLQNLPSEKLTKKQFAEIATALQHKEERIRLVTFNMLINDHKFNIQPENQWPIRLPLIVETLQEMNPDVINAQELYPDQVADLLAKMGETYAAYGLPSESTIKGEINAIFYRKDRFEILQQEHYAAEGVSLLQLKDVRTGKSFAVLNTHLAYSKIEKREEQVEFIAQKGAEISAIMPAIFTGDLNTFPMRLDLKRLPFYDGDYLHRILTAGPFTDAKERALLGHLGPISTFTNASDDGIPFKGVGTPGVMLDHIYVTKGIEVLMHAVQPATVKGQFPSDHMPVFIDFLL